MADGVDLGSAFGRIELDGSQAIETVNSLSKTMRDAGTAMSLGVTAPLAGIATMAVNSAADFEQSLNIMQQVSGATADQMATLQAQALNLGAVTSFSAGEAADAMLELAKAGLSVDDVIAATPGVLDMAAAGGMGLAESAEIAANAMNAFNLPASEMGNVANMLAAAANASSVDIGDLAAAMKMSGAVFASNKQPMDDMVTALAMLGNAGLKGSDAGTSLKTMMLSLASPTDKAAAVLKDMGLAVYDAQGNMRGFSDILNDLSIATAKMSDEERNAALSTVFGSDAIRAATILTRDYGESWDGLSDALGEGGAAANVAGARMKGMRGAMEYLQGSIDSFLIGAALPYLNALGDFVRMGADALSAFSALPRPIMDAAVAFGAVLAAAGPLMLLISGITAAIGFLLSPVGLLVAGLAALAAGFVLWQQNFGGVQQKVAAFANQLKTMVKATTGIDFDAVADGVRSLGSYLRAVAEDGDYLNDWLTHLPEPIQPAVQALGQLVAAFGGLAQTGDFGAFIASIQAIDWGGLLADAAAGLNSLKDGMVAALQGIDWAGALQTAGGWLDSLKDGVVAAIQSIPWGEALSAAGNVFMLLAGWVTAALREVPWGTALETAAGWLDALKNGVVGAIQGIPWGEALAAAGSFLDTLKNGVITAIQTIPWGEALTAAGDGLANLWGGVIAALKTIPWGTALAGAAGWLDGLTQGAINRIKTINWGAKLAEAGSFLSGLWNNVIAALKRIPWTTALSTAAGWLGGLTQGVINRIKTVNWGALLAEAGDFLANLWRNVVAALGRIPWGTALSTATTWLTNLTSQVVTAIQGIKWGEALTAAGAVFGGLETAVTGALTGLGFAGAAQALDGVKAALEGLPTAITSAKSSFGGLLEQVTPIATQLRDFFAPSLERLQTAFTALPENLTPLLPKLQELGGAFGGLFQALAPFVALVGGVLAIAVDFGINSLTAAFETLPAILGVIIDQVTATINLISTVLNEVVTAVKAAIDGDWGTVWQSAQDIAQAFITFFRGQFARLGTFMAAVAKRIADPIIKTLEDLGVNVQPVLDGIKKTFETVWGAIQTAIQAVVDVVGKVTDAISGFKTFLDGLQLRNPFEGIAAAGQSVLDAIGKVGNAVSGGGADGDPATPEAGGTSYFVGGLAQINERGYEQVMLPAGSRVYTSGQTNQMRNEEPRPVVINIDVKQMGNEMDARRLGHILRDQLVLLGV